MSTLAQLVLGFSEYTREFDEMSCVRGIFKQLSLARRKKKLCSPSWTQRIAIRSYRLPSRNVIENVRDGVRDVGECWARSTHRSDDSQLYVTYLTLHPWLSSISDRKKKQDCLSTSFEAATPRPMFTKKTRWRNIEDRIVRDWKVKNAVLKVWFGFY